MAPRRRVPGPGPRDLSLLLCHLRVRTVVPASWGCGGGSAPPQCGVRSSAPGWFCRHHRPTRSQAAGSAARVALAPAQAQRGHRGLRGRNSKLAAGRAEGSESRK